MLLAFISGLFLAAKSNAQTDNFCYKEIKKITGVNPKSIVRSPDGKFYAQNMMYKHTITVYDDQGKLLKTIKDDVNLAQKTGNEDYSGMYQGSPVEAAFTPDGKYVWVSNYQMYGNGFKNPGNDKCLLSQSFDHSVIYKINCSTYEIENVVEVGSVPKFMMVTPDNSKLLVSNWCSGSVTIIDNHTNKILDDVTVGLHPRGIAIDTASRFAYVTVMGGYKVVKIGLNSYHKMESYQVGTAPRHVQLDKAAKNMYVAMGFELGVVKWDVQTNEIVGRVQTGTYPRTMIINEKDDLGYVVNYADTTFSVFKLSTMELIRNVKTGVHPIGITYDPKNENVWVACYAGSIRIYHQTKNDCPVYVAPERDNLVASSDGGTNNNSETLFENTDSQDGDDLTATSNNTNKTDNSSSNDDALSSDNITSTQKSNEDEDNNLILDFGDDSDANNNNSIASNTNTKTETNNSTSTNTSEASKTVTNPSWQDGMSIIDQKYDVSRNPDNSNNTFHIVVGRFGNPENIARQIRSWNRRGFKPYTLSYKAGTRLVVVSGFETWDQADVGLSEVLEYQSDAWIYQLAPKQ